MIEILKTNINEIELLRTEYLNSLPEFQEAYMEILVEKSGYFKLCNDGLLIGYVIKTDDNILVEFYLMEKFIPKCADYFKIAVERLNIAKVYCKSFDYLLLNCCMMHSYSYKLIGTLFRDYIETDKFPSNDLLISVAEESDYEFLLQQEDGLYETPEELELYVKGRNILMFKKNGQLLGCGYLIKIHCKWDYYDIGMWVNPDFRKQGIATKIIFYLKEHCLKNNWRPICGCAIDNIASQKTLEKNGFISKHKLIEFVINNDKSG